MMTAAVDHLCTAQEYLAATRLQDAQTERIRLLLHEAEQRLLTATQEAPGRYVVRDPNAPGVCQLTSVDACTCPRYGVWHRCEHLALIRNLEGLI